ncbi:Lrp/AsnC family transcriptional regulator [Thermococcus sp. MAR1]|uniref:Lrp/AsnC family transcriptional regulator n=1 Tax=Thermococcus sp. MAR1 TaxID=1638263 RepID=UPI00143C8F4C|nr:Lrp/AsnC family transcriptional regulator [Thermococcus sp. MAR1]NJE10921.1 Lrp/AsnC family transcriptional regulator [Thermococcus sp. MAR1]
MGEPIMEELEFLVEILEKHPLDSLRKIAEEEGIDYYRLKRLYDKYYGKYLTVSAIYNIRAIGLRSYLAFLSVPSDRILETGYKITQNPFVAFVNPAFGFKNGLSAILQIPDDQKDRIDEMLSKYSDDYEYYEVRAYPYKGDDNFGEWNLSHDYAVLMDILKADARTPVTKIARKLGKSRPTVKFMINRLESTGILLGFEPIVENNIHDRSVLGITTTLDETVLERFKEYEISVGVLPGKGYVLEWFFSSKEDLGTKILEFSNYVDRILISYFDPTFKELNDRNGTTKYSRMVKENGSGYRSILEF